MTSAAVQEGREARRGMGGGQRVRALLKPLFRALDHLLHPQEGALAVSIFLALERIFLTISLLIPGVHQI